MKVFNSAVLGTRAQRSGNFVVVKKTGLIVFSKDMNELFKGKDPRVNFLQDEKRPKDWYVELTKQETGISIRYFEKIGRFGIQSSVICKAILESCKLEDSSEFQVSSDPDTTDGGGKSYAILTATASPCRYGSSKKRKTDGE